MHSIYDILLIINNFIVFERRLNVIRNIREEIEQVDTNLIRYNVRKISDDFLKKVVEYSSDKDTSALFQPIVSPPNVKKTDTKQTTSQQTASNSAQTKAAASTNPTPTAASANKPAANNGNVKPMTNQEPIAIVISPGNNNNNNNNTANTNAPKVK